MNAGAFTFFTIVWNAIYTPIVAAELPIIAALQNWVSGWFILAITTYLVAMLLIAAYTPGEEGVTRFFRQLFLAGVVWSLAATSAGFTTYVTGFTTGLLTSINGAIVGSFGGTGVTAAGSFDAIANTMIAVGAVTMKHVPWYSIVKGLGMLLVVDIYIIGAIIVIGVMFTLFLLSSVILGFLLMFGPVFVACFFFPFTRQFCDGWVRTVVAALVTQIFITGITTLFTVVVLAVITPIIASLSATSNITGDDSFGQVVNLMLLLMVCAIFFFLAIYVTRLAQSIAGGAHAHFARLPNVLPSLSPSGAPASAPAGSGAGGGGFGGAAPAGAGGGGGGGRQFAFARTVGSAP